MQYHNHNFTKMSSKAVHKRTHRKSQSARKPRLVAADTHAVAVAQEAELELMGGRAMQLTQPISGGVGRRQGARLARMSTTHVGLASTQGEMMHGVKQNHYLHRRSQLFTPECCPAYRIKLILRALNKKQAAPRHYMAFGKEPLRFGIAMLRTKHSVVAVVADTKGLLHHRGCPATCHKHELRRSNNRLSRQLVSPFGRSQTERRLAK